MSAESFLRRTKLFRSLALSLAGFLIILFGLNLYQYLRVRTDLASGLLAQVGERETGELKAFFQRTGSQLQLVRDWGKNGTLDPDDPIALNKKFFPLLERQPEVSGLLLVNPDASEYYLTRKENKWLTRHTEPSRQGKNLQIFRLWTTPEKGEELRRTKSSYDPRQRPWYLQEQDREQPFWTAPYVFSGSGKKGITASVSWPAADSENGHWVFAFDISLARIQQLMRRQNPAGSGVMFLVNTTTNTVIPGTLPSDGPAATEINGMLVRLVDQWNQKDTPARTPLRYHQGKRPWVATFQPLLPQKTDFWIGVAAPEGDLIDSLGGQLFRIDLTDTVVATVGGLFLLLIIWKVGGFRGEGRGRLDPVLHLHELINQGEGPRVEFKSTVRTNLKTGKRGKEIELAWLKALVAFLNSQGGTLLIGVTDSGRICGLDQDGFASEDKCLLHVKNLVNQHIGAQFSAFIEVSLLETDGKEVLMIETRRAGLPVFLLIGKNEEFYIRSGPSSVKLTPRQMISYVLQNRLTKKG